MGRYASEDNEFSPAGTATAATHATTGAATWSRPSRPTKTRHHELPLRTGRRTQEGIETERENQHSTRRRPQSPSSALGYVGLPLAVGFDDTGFDVVGYDVSQRPSPHWKRGRTSTGDLGDEAIVESEVSFTTSPDAISRAEYVVVTVPTPVDDDDRPSMEYVVAAGKRSDST